MRPKNNIRIYVALVVAWVVLLVLQRFAHVNLKPGNLLIYAVDSLAPIPVIVLVVVFLIGLLMESREQRARKQQLMFIKSAMFRLELRKLYIADFLALKTPEITFANIRTASLQELRRMREEANAVEYRSLEAMEPVIMEYVAAEDTWRRFMQIALDNDFSGIFQDMIYILHFIGDVVTFKELHPDELFIYEATKDKETMNKVMRVLGDGIRKYLEYVIELKERQPELADQVIADYELVARTQA